MEINTFEWKLTKKDRKELIAEALRLYRAERNLTQREVADAIGVNFSTYNSYENGAAEPCAEYLVRLSHVLGVSVDMLVQQMQIEYSSSLEAVKKLKDEYEKWAAMAEESGNPAIKAALKEMKKALDLEMQKLYSPEYEDSNAGKIIRIELENTDN